MTLLNIPIGKQATKIIPPHSRSRLTVPGVPAQASIPAYPRPTPRGSLGGTLLWLGGGLLLVVARLLIYFIRTIAFPKTQWLVKQYREAYERFLCPVCEYPIRTGPRRFLFWTRRTVNKMVVPTGRCEEDEAYTCPACGSVLFEECPDCHKVRHAMLPHCSRCGAEKDVK